MQAHAISNYHITYLPTTRHWHAESETYTGADALLTALQQGWTMLDGISTEDHYFSGNRSIRIYNIDLQRGSAIVTMHVIHNPYVTRMLREKHFTIKQ